MTIEQTVTVSLEDLCDFADAVDGMMHDLESGQRDHLRRSVDRIHIIVERWAVDETVLGGGCHPDHRCRLCRDNPRLASQLVRWHRQAGADSATRRDSEGEETPEMSEPLQMGRKVTYTHEDEDFILEHISQSVVQVTHEDDRGYFGLSANRDSTYPYTWTGHDMDVQSEGIAYGRVYFNFHSTPKAALDALCCAMLNENWGEQGRGVS